MLTGLKSRMMNAARSPNAERALFVVSFAESSFFPLPPDLMLGPMAAAEPSKWLRYALVCTVASVLGGLAGYAIGMFLMDQVGRYILDFFGYSGGREMELRAFYDQYGAWFIFLKGLTPIPYKLVTILSGALHFSIPIFILASTLTRGLRFALVAWIFQKFGPQIAPVMEKRMGLVLIVVAVVLVAAVLALKYIPH
ncbi:cytochrome B [Candidatus Viadribacter manganicus]|uniref:Cytochrome B n=2 Tax=Candidatus Viadribacter manganicus TaxID=1759059 RepID=A0A1B1AMV7_9PROT|nr:cytochrome B [Candidatus Viadribacter manganicus]